MKITFVFLKIMLYFLLKVKLIGIKYRSVNYMCRTQKSEIYPNNEEEWKVSECKKSQSLPKFYFISDSYISL